MLTTNRLAIVAVLIMLASSASLKALDPAVDDYEERQQIATLVDKLKRGIQEQDVELIFGELCVDSTMFQKIKDELKALAEAEFKEDSTVILRSPHLEYYREKENAIKSLFANLGDQPVKKPLSSFTDTWFLDVEQKGLQISENKEEASLDLLVGSTIAPPDSSYLNQLTSEEKASLSNKEIEKLLYYRPVSLLLIKIRNKWRISNFDDLFALVRKD